MRKRAAGMVVAALLVLCAPTANGRSVDLRLMGRSSQGLRVTVVVRSHRTVYVAMTVVTNCTVPPQPPLPPGVAGPPVAERRQLLAFSATIGRRGGFAFAVRSFDQRIQVFGRVRRGAVRGQAHVAVFGPGTNACFARVGFSAERRRPRPR